MKMEFTEVTVDPNDLRFSQDSIAPYVCSPTGQDVQLNETLEKLQSGELHPNDFPPLEVSEAEDGLLWSNDNRRLWLFRKTGISQITVKVFNIPLSKAPPRSDCDRACMSNPYFFPTIRRPVTEVNPNAIRFSQISIDPYLTSPSGQNVPLEENLEKLRSGHLKPDDFPPLDVSRDEDGVLWSNDNERLWLFRKAGLLQITVKICRKPLSRAPSRNDRDRALMSSPDFFPTIRGQSKATAPASTQPEANNSDGSVKLNPDLIRFSEKSEHTASTSTNLKADAIDAVGKMSPNAIRFSEKTIAPYGTTPSGKNIPLGQIVEFLNSRQVSPETFQPLEVSRDKDGVLWANDNEISVKVSCRPLSKAPPRSDKDRDLMASPDFFPSIRGQSQETHSASTNIKADNIVGWVVGAAVAASTLFLGWKLYKK